MRYLSNENDVKKCYLSPHMILSNFIKLDIFLIKFDSTITYTPLFSFYKNFHSNPTVYEFFIQTFIIDFWS